MEFLVAALASSALFVGLGLLSRHRASAACGCAAGECLRESVGDLDEDSAEPGQEGVGRCRRW